MFAPEDVWTSSLSLTENITLPGLSPLFPNVTCHTDGSVCHITTGEAEINAACTVSALVLSDYFDLTSTYL
jgi:purine nucleoside permease